MNQAIIAVGSNFLSEDHVHEARAKASVNLKFLKTSSFRWTDAVLDGTGQYYNGLWMIETEWDFEKLKDYLKKLEKDLGRQGRDRKQIPIDLDIIFWNHNVVDFNLGERTYLKEFFEELGVSL